MDENVYFDQLRVSFTSSKLGDNVKLYKPYKIDNAVIGSYSYIAENSIISETIIGKFCSIGPNLVCGWGIHPISGISTAPMFYSTCKQNGITLSLFDKIIERKRISIGNDVFIGANVTILDGVTIGDGAIIGAGAVVSKDIPPYAIAVGVPIQVLKFRFENDTIEKLMQIKWWDSDEGVLKDLEAMFFKINDFVDKYAKG
ncbi:CatB-related O-acetyltransferase [Larkinella sp. GY13]